MVRFLGLNDNKTNHFLFFYRFKTRIFEKNPHSRG